MPEYRILGAIRESLEFLLRHVAVQQPEAAAAAAARRADLENACKEYEELNARRSILIDPPLASPEPADPPATTEPARKKKTRTDPDPENATAAD